MFESQTTIEAFHTECEVLNAEIIAAHNAHYESSSTGLIDPTESPNKNIIHSLFTDGGITYEKGGWAYGQRSSFDKEFGIDNYKILKLKFPKPANYGLSYAILTEEECYKFRNRINDLVTRLPKGLTVIR